MLYSKPDSAMYSFAKVKLLSHVRLFVTPWTVAYQAPPSIGFSRQECWSGLPFPSPGDLPDPGIEARSPALQTHTLPSEPIIMEIRNETTMSYHFRSVRMALIKKTRYNKCW